MIMPVNLHMASYVYTDSNACLPGKFGGMTLIRLLCAMQARNIPRFCSCNLVCSQAKSRNRLMTSGCLFLY